MLSALHQLLLRTAMTPKAGLSSVSQAGPGPLALPPIGTFAVFPGTAGDDTFTGTNGADTFNMGDGGRDTVSGRQSEDLFVFGAEFDRNDTIDGGQQNDTLMLAGNYAGSRAVVFKATTMTQVETLQLTGGSFTLTLDDANVVNNAILTVDASSLGASRTLTFDGSAETEGQFDILAGAGLAVLTGGAGADNFHFGGTFTSANRIDGGAGHDGLFLDGDYSAGLIFESGTIRNMGYIDLAAGHSYSLTLDNGNAAFGQELIVNGSGLGAGEHLFFDGSDESSARLVVFGGAGNDTLLAGGGRDFIDPRGGDDIVLAGDGDDTINLRALLTETDQIDGGDGTDILILDGDYAAGVVLGFDTIRHIEQINLVGSQDYDLTLDSSNVHFGEALTINGTGVTFGHSLTFDGSAIGDGVLRILGGFGNDEITFGQSGRDIVRAGNSDDTIFSLGNLTEDVRIDGGSGVDTLVLNGDYGDRLEFSSRTMRNVEVLSLVSGARYNIALADGNVADTRTLTVLADTAAILIFDGSAESNGHLIVQGSELLDRISVGGGANEITSLDGNDVIDCSAGGDDTIEAGDGNDTIAFGAELNAGDFIDGGAGTDTIVLDGDTSSALLRLEEVEVVELTAGHDYDLSASAANTGATTIQGSELGAHDILTFSCVGTTNGHNVVGGAGDDVLTGGSVFDSLIGNAGDDQLRGGPGADQLIGGAGVDRFIYGPASESTSVGFDLVLALNLNEDKFDLPGVNPVTGIDGAVNAGALSNTSAATFDANLTAAMNGNLLANHALLFTPNAGTLAGQKMLVIDVNGSAGYQTGADIVINVTPGLAGTLSTGDFI